MFLPPINMLMTWVCFVLFFAFTTLLPVNVSYTVCCSMLSTWTWYMSCGDNVGIIIPNRVEGRTCSKRPTRCIMKLEPSDLRNWTQYSMAPCFVSIDVIQCILVFRTSKYWGYQLSTNVLYLWDWPSRGKNAMKPLELSNLINLPQRPPHLFGFHGWPICPRQQMHDS